MTHQKLVRIVVLASAMALPAVRPAAAQAPPPPFTTAPFQPVATPGAVFVSPDLPFVPICTPYMYDASAQRSQPWFVKADGSGTMTVTLVVGLESGNGVFGNPTPGGTLAAQVFNAAGALIGQIAPVASPAFSPPANIGQTTIPTVAGAIYRVQIIGTPSGGPSFPELYRLHVDGAENAALSAGPSSIAPFSSAHDGVRWVVNVAPGEALNVAILPGAPGPLQILGTQVRVLDPSFADHTGVITIPPAGTTISIPSSEAGAHPGSWIVLVVQPSDMPQQRSPYRIQKQDGADRGVYASWFTDGKAASLTGTISAPAAVPFVQAHASGGNDAILSQDVLIPTNQLFHSNDATPDAGQLHVTLTPPPGWTAMPAAFDVPIICGRASAFSAQIVDVTPPQLTVPADVTLEATSPSGAVAVFTPTASDSTGGPTTVSCSPESGSAFALGTTTVTCTASDEAGNLAQGSFHVTVRDTTPPLIASIVPSTGSLWPPDHKMAPVSFVVTARDAADAAPACSITGVSSSEPPYGAGDGNTMTDWAITGPLTVNLRAERSGGGAGRIYTATVACVDASGNRSTGTAAIAVAHDQGR